MKSAEEVAREIIGGPHDCSFMPDDAAFCCSIGDLDGQVSFRSWPSTQEAEVELEQLVAIVTRIIERARAEGYAAGKAEGAREERGRLRRVWREYGTRAAVIDAIAPEGHQLSIPDGFGVASGDQSTQPAPTSAGSSTE